MRAIFASILAPTLAATLHAAGFEQSVLPVLAKSCAPCHNDRLASGSLNLAPFHQPASVLAQRDGWERIVQKARRGTPPGGGSTTSWWSIRRSGSACSRPTSSWQAPSPCPG
jgi:hypothetical protein